MGIVIGIRHEDKYEMETRVPIVPGHVEWLVKHHNIDVVVQTSDKRVYKDEEFIKAGATVESDLKRCPIIFGVKEIPIPTFESKKTYIFFSHVIKGQKYNMPMLKKMMDLKCNLIDYEKVVDEQNKRLIFFGKYAGLAGMINSFWALGLRLKYYGYDSKLLKIKQAKNYKSLAEAKEDISSIGQLIAENGTPEELRPFTIGITGYGNVSQGVQEICGLLPVKEISPEKLLSLKNRKNLPNNIIYKVIFKEEHLVQPINPNDEFELQDYYNHPEKYRSVFEKYIPHLSMLLNCMYWDTKYPKLITKDYLKKLYSKGRPKLNVIGDITCDIDGSIECTTKPATIKDPIYIYNPFTGQATNGYEGEGILDMAVDILPSELPRDASLGFSDVLVNFVKPIAIADYDLPYEEIDLPRAIKKALILLKGELTPNYKYLEEYVKQEMI
ncbi:MAG TPA: bifunctional lysine ketoglutarate reductase /saccharopine dehydrogenase family protein [Bacteroidales bacterium]|nr:bifunctional lysine ketoglutarate reductase /saccharopine dehydrogenase family protein [Bacteroidales bacterium]HPS17104.1 bifunctional lysine ketoglutarate reductase /saccharopine dehydrogenase family protein [Bacteroidales bacterium]